MSRLALFLLSALAASTLSGCSLFRTVARLPKTLGEGQTAYNYIPLDPLPVKILQGDDCTRISFVNGSAEVSTGTPKDYLQSLPDEAVRMAVGQYDTSGTLIYGPVKTAVSNHNYQVVLDYVSVDTTDVPVYIQRFDSGKAEVELFQDVPFPTTYQVAADPTFGPKGDQRATAPKGVQVIIPVYVGVGLRLTAAVKVTNASANLSSLGTIAADAEAGKLTGSLTVQTLGVTGKSVSTTLPLPSELNRTTIQNAILALGSIKAVLYDSGTDIAPRVVGIYNPVGGGQQVVNGIISILAKDPVPWNRPCTPPVQALPNAVPTVLPVPAPTVAPKPAAAPTAAVAN